MNNLSFKALIREEAQRLGFFRMGVASARIVPEVEHFRSWLEQGFHGNMSYLERQASKRENPDLVLPGVRTILALAMNYYVDKPLLDSPLKGRISRYAWGSDYHDIVRLRLNQLLDYIISCNPSINGRCYADTGPVMEKIWSSETSLGWMGKHTNIITRQGSWFFIGVILLNISMEPDPKEENFCGKCSRCIQACPTGAIVAPYMLDARLCISYLTIELRGSIPLHLRSRIGNRIFGCDECQQVCPWNRFAQAGTENELAPRREALTAELVELIRISPKEFKQRFRNSPILRATRDGFVRNVAVALGNSRSKDAIQSLTTALQDQSPLVRSHAAWALGQIGSDAALQGLRAALSQEKAPEALDEIRLAIETCVLD
jgi:epoxyqueuosine reductase